MTRPSVVVVAVAIAILAAAVAASAQSPGDVQSPDTSPSPGATQPVSVGYRPGTLEIVLEPWADGLSEPVFLTPDGTHSGLLYVVEKRGTVRAAAPDGEVATEPLLDIKDRVLDNGEQGMLGLAFHPDYATNGRLFVYYTRLSDSFQVVSEFQATDGVADADSERIILEMADFAANHNGGMLAFDADGMLLIGTGDGGGGGDPEQTGQDVTQLLGKLLRIDVDGTEPYEVPVNDPDGHLGPDALPEIRATGLRNPWRFSVDRLTGDVFIGDVGQGEWEEIDVLPAGRGGVNFGWSTLEGSHCFEAEHCDRDGTTPPVAEYSHSVGGCTVVGGYVYRGAMYPALTGAYLFGDYCSGNLWLLSAADAVTDGAATLDPVGNQPGSPSAFGQDEEGELYLLDLGGQILRVTAVER